MEPRYVVESAARKLPIKDDTRTRLKTEATMPERTKAPAERPKPRPPSMNAPAMRGKMRNREAALKVMAVPIASPAVSSPKRMGPAHPAHHHHATLHMLPPNK